VVKKYGGIKIKVAISFYLHSGSSEVEIPNSHLNYGLDDPPAGLHASWLEPGGTEQEPLTVF